MDIIVDIDGTLADIQHRRHYVASKPKNWKAFNAAMHLDTLKKDVAMVIRTLWLGHDQRDKEEHRIILASGRGEESRQVTTDWLLSQEIWASIRDPYWVYPRLPLFVYERLYMRAKGDNRSDVIVKREILTQMRLDGYQPMLAFDDRDGVVAMWREAGLTCFQVAEGNF